MTIYLLALALWFASPAQSRINNETALTADQRAVLPLVELAEIAILQGDRSRLQNMFETSDSRVRPDQARNIAAFLRRFENPADVISCVIFDTACVRAEMKKAAVTPNDRFVSVREFLEKRSKELQITFQDVSDGSVQVTLHLPLRPDSATVPPPAGLYEALSIGFIKTDSEWKVNILFPEAYQAAGIAR